MTVNEPSYIFDPCWAKGPDGSLYIREVSLIRNPDIDTPKYNPVAEAYQILVAALDKDETNMYELAAAMQEAIGFLGEALE